MGAVWSYWWPAGGGEGAGGAGGEGPGSPRPGSPGSPRGREVAVARVRLMSYNVLWQPLVTPQRYEYCRRPQDLEWAHRLALMRAEVERLRPDVLCLQEVELTTVAEDFAMPGYACVVHRKKKKKLRHDHTTGNATFYRTDLFSGVRWELHKSRTIAVELEWAAAPGDDDGGGGGGGGGGGNDATAAARRTTPPPPPPAPPLLVINCHLEANPTKGEARVHQLRRTLFHVRERAEASETGVAGAAVVICGDFNSFEGQAAYRLLTDGSLPPGLVEFGQVVTEQGEEQPFPFRSSYREALGHEAHFTFVPSPGHPERLPPCTMDFIMHTAPAMACTGAVLPCLPEEEPALAERGVPDSMHGSDHLPVCADLRVYACAPARPAGETAAQTSPSPAPSSS